MLTALTVAKEISIHALVKRATEPYYDSNTNPINFNPRPRKEGDLGRLLI